MISITPVAAERIKKAIEVRGKGLGIRFGVKTTGCSGYSYVIEFVDEIQPADQVFEQHGVKVMVDAKSLPFVDGTEINYTKEKLSEGFSFSNPNLKNECGCKMSFNI